VSVERLNIPAIGVMTVKFQSAAELMARALGAEGYPFVAIDHPISSADDAMLADRARFTVEKGLAILMG